jgi:hypothetical protein
MKDEFIITLWDNKKYKFTNVKKISKKIIKNEKKYISTIDEKISKWKIK